MTGLEIGGLVTVVTVGAAIFGLQVWKCSQNSQAEESKDALIFDLEECSVDGAKITIKGLHVKANEVDKANHQEKHTEGKIGDEAVSLAALGTIGGHGGGVLSSVLPPPAVAPGSESGATNPPASTAYVSANNAQGSGSAPHILPSNGPQATHIVQTKAAMVDVLANALIQFVSQYTEGKLAVHQPNDVTTPLLQQGVHEDINVSVTGEGLHDLETGHS